MEGLSTPIVGLTLKFEPIPVAIKSSDFSEYRWNYFNERDGLRCADLAQRCNFNRDTGVASGDERNMNI